MFLEVPDSLFAVIPAVQDLLNMAAAQLSLPSETAAIGQPDFERAVRDHTMAIERSVHASVFRSLDMDVEGLVVGAQRYRRSHRAKLEVLTMAGPVVVERVVYRVRGSQQEPNIGVLDLRLCLVDGRTTPAAAQVLSTFLATGPPSQAATLLTATRTCLPSTSTLDRLGKVIHDAFEPQRAQIEEEVRLAELRAEKGSLRVKLLVVSMDGVMVRMKDAPNTPGASKTEDVPHGHQEAASATVTLWGEDGSRLRTVGFARMPESKKVTLQAQLKAELSSALDRYPNAHVVFLADGASENWRILREIQNQLKITNYVMVNDFYHAAEHLVVGLKAGRTDVASIPLWTARLKTAGGVDACIAELGRLAATRRVKSSPAALKAVTSEITYLNNQRDRMDYAKYVRDGIPIGSGIQEAACKTYVVQRHKASGMAWRTRGGQGIMTLRALLLSNRLDHAWNRLVTRLRRPFSVDSSFERINAARLAA